VSWEVLVWWAVGIGVWLLTLSSFAWPEFWLAVATTLPCAVMAVVARRAAEAQWAWPWEALRWLALIPVAILTDAAGVLWRPWSQRRPDEGHFSVVRLAAVGHSPRVATRRALSAIAVSVTPGSYVVDVDPDSGEMTIHSLSSARPRMEEVVAR
jgi:multisubunit Na+/H+ antiporter MnhE subunit